MFLSDLGVDRSSIPSTGVFLRFRLESREPPSLLGSSARRAVLRINLKGFDAVRFDFDLYVSKRPSILSRAQKICRRSHGHLRAPVITCALWRLPGLRRKAMMSY